MPTTRVLRNVPDEVRPRLKASAESHHRRPDGKASVCLEGVPMGGRRTSDEIIATARALRASMPQGVFTTTDIDAFKRDGRR